MLAGNHHCLTLIKYINTLENEVSRIKKAIKETMGGKSEAQVSKMDLDQQNLVRDAEHRVKSLQEKINTSTIWAIRVYNRGVSFHHPHLSLPPPPTLT